MMPRARYVLHDMYQGLGVIKLGLSKLLLTFVTVLYHGQVQCRRMYCL